MKVYQLGEPNARQLEFFGAQTRYVAYGGARGGGKSWAVRKKAVLLALRYPDCRILIVRRTLPELRENHTRPLMADLNGIAVYRETDKTFTFSNGSLIRLGFCANEADVLQYQGQEYDFLFLDEATQLTEYQYMWIASCCRGSNGIPKRIYLTCNPGGVGHAWVKRLFIDRDYHPGERAEDYTFIPAPRIRQCSAARAGSGLPQLAGQPAGRTASGLAGRRLGRLSRPVFFRIFQSASCVRAVSHPKGMAAVRLHGLWAGYVRCGLAGGCTGWARLCL